MVWHGLAMSNELIIRGWRIAKCKHLSQLSLARKRRHDGEHRSCSFEGGKRKLDENSGIEVETLIRWSTKQRTSAYHCQESR